MNARYDGIPMKLTARFVRALKEVMRAECEMMRIEQPDYKECWTWGECEVGDLSRINGISFTYGGEDTRPKGKRWIVTVLPKARAGKEGA